MSRERENLVSHAADPTRDQGDENERAQSDDEHPEVEEQDKIDEASDASFPSSDPPSW